MKSELKFSKPWSGKEFFGWIKCFTWPGVLEGRQGLATVVVIIPIHKKRNRKECTIYRGISHLSLTGKCMPSALKKDAAAELNQSWRLCGHKTAAVNHRKADCLNRSSFRSWPIWSRILGNDWKSAISSTSGRDGIWRRVPGVTVFDKVRSREIHKAWMSNNFSE